MKFTIVLFAAFLATASANAADIHCWADTTKQDPDFPIPAFGSDESEHDANYHLDFTLTGVGTAHVVFGGSLTKTATYLTAPVVSTLDNVDSAAPGNSLTRRSQPSVLWSNGHWIASFHEKSGFENGARDFQIYLSGFISSRGALPEVSFDTVGHWKCATL